MPAKKTTSTAKKASKPVAPKAKTTEVRNSPIPKPVVASPAKAAPRVITYEAIAERAYYIWQREGGSEFDNWVKAERELRGA